MEAAPAPVESSGELVRSEPAGPLGALVSAYYGYVGSPEPVRRREGPEGDVVVTVSFDTVWWIGDVHAPDAPGARHTSFAAGLHDAQALVGEQAGRSAGMQVNLRPAAARALFRVPMHELAHRVVPLDDLLGRDAALLAEALQSSPDWTSRFRLLDATLLRRLAAAPPPDAETARAYERLRASRGRLRVETLASELGWSRKRLATRFREHVGLPPKAAARVLRFRRALDLVERGGLGWAELALEAGFYDQAHLVNEFRAFTGTTPTRHDPIFQDPATAGA